MGPDAGEIYDNLKFESPDDKNNLKKVMEKLEDFFVGDTHEAFETYKFHLRKQEVSESIAALRKLAKMCNFDKLEERLIRDQVIGVRQQSERKNSRRQRTDIKQVLVNWKGLWKFQTAATVNVR